MLFDMFKKVKDNILEIPFKNKEAEESPFKSYGDDEMVVLDNKKNISDAEFEFLMSIGYLDELSKKILKIIAAHGVITSKQLLFVLNNTEQFKNTDQKTVKKALQKLSHKSFVKKGHFYASRDGEIRSSFAIYSLGVHGKKLISDMGCLPQNSIFWLKTPAYKQKYVLATTQVLQQFSDIFTEIIRYPLLSKDDMSIRFSGMAIIQGREFIIECVRSTTESHMYLPDRLNRFEYIIQNYRDLGFENKPEMLVIAESPKHANEIVQVFKDISEKTNIYYTFDNAKEIDDIVDKNGRNILL